MSLGELLLTFIVALLVFGPNKLPMLARHLGKAIARLQTYKQLVNAFWQKQLLEEKLKENIKRAERAESSYK